MRDSMVLNADEPRKANQCIADAKRLKPAALLFDEFWREGELALLFGAQGYWEEHPRGADR